MRFGRPSHSTVVAYVALFAALSGSAFAISKGAIKAKHIAKNAVRAKQIAPNAVGTSEILNGAVTNPKLATAAVTGPKLAADSVDAGKILDNSLTNDELADAAQFNGAAADGDLDGTYPNPTLEASSVAAAEVANGSLGTAELSAGIPAVRVTNTGDQAMSELSFNTAAFNSERYDTAAMHSTTTNNSRLTAPVDGLYLVSASVRWESDPDGIRQLALEGDIGGTTTPLGSSDIPSTGLSNQNVSTVVQLSAGDFVTVEVRHDSGETTLDLDKSNASSPEFMMAWLAPGP